MELLIHGQIELQWRSELAQVSVSVKLRSLAPKFVRLARSFFQTEWEQRRRERLLLDGEREIRAL
jgi:hypothetical protein